MTEIKILIIKSKMKYSKIFWITALILTHNYSYSQINTFSICNTFDSNITLINIDTTSIWEIGKPSKSPFDSSYSGTNSIITDLDSLYPNKDTSIFYASYSYHDWIPNYLGLYYPLEIEFTHRFNTDSLTDYGTIEMSFDGGNKWYDVLSNTHNSLSSDYDNYHYFEGSGDTIFDSLSITGNSHGWVHSKISKEIEQLIFNDTLFHVDTILLKFTFITDSIGRHKGWQIDDLCITLDFFLTVEEQNSLDQFHLSPNPNNGTFKINVANGLVRQLHIFDINGTLVYNKPNVSSGSIIKTYLNPGLYFVKIVGKETSYRIQKMIVK